MNITDYEDVGVPTDLPLPANAPTEAQFAQTRRSIRRKIFYGAIVALIGLGASVLSCVGQSFHLRQARALENIEQQLAEMNARCR